MPVSLRSNRTFLRVHGLQRSGNHAVINWIASQSRDLSILLNDATPHEDPIATMQEYAEYSDGQLMILDYTWDGEKRDKTASQIPSQCNLLICSYEDRAISKYDSHTFARWIGESDSFYDVLIVRDPLNFVASRMRMFETWDSLSGLSEIHSVVELWKAYVREALGITSCLSSESKVIVNFGRWKDDIVYRQELAARLNLTFSDRGLEMMLGIGGSSFDGFSYATRASEMKVNERWKNYLDNADFRAALADAELQELSIKFFGRQEGWARLFPESFSADAPTR